MKIALATDHAGYEALAELKIFVEDLGHEYVDFGPQQFDVTDDYPDYMFPAAHAVADGACDVAIILGGSGQGEAMAVNRVKGVRCTLFYGLVAALAPIDATGTISEDPYEILRLSRQHNFANVLSLAGRFLSLDEMKQAITIWLDTPWSEDERHARRVGKLDELA